ncbi:MAG: hypothetical protein AAFO75_02660, partial [Pseudomonadota bacterium]
FDLDNVKRMMEEIKKKADAARVGPETSEPAPTVDVPKAATIDPRETAAGSNKAVKPSKSQPATTSAKPEALPNGRTTAAGKTTTATKPSTKAAASPPLRDSKMLQNRDGRPVDPVKAAAREEEADEVLKAIRRARAARDAWLNDDPDPVLDRLPKTPPARRFPNPAQADPRIEAAKPDRTNRQAAAPADDRAFGDDIRRSLGGPDARELLPIVVPDKTQRTASPVYELSNDSVVGPGSDPLRKLRKPTRRVTVLLVMDVGKTGVRRWSKTADPMLCLHEYCFLSRGPGKSAVRHRRQVAFGPSIALGKRGLACRSSPACIFRNVDLGALEARLQPVDLRFLRHDRREAELVKADTTCRMSGDVLACSAPIKGKSWRAWIVPELVAELAGEAALKKALADGLGGDQPVTAKTNKKRYRNR